MYICSRKEEKRNIDKTGKWPQMNQETLDFIRQHANDDVRKLALEAPRSGEVDVPFALNQIAGRQTAQRKLPLWAAVEGLIYPPHLSMEQCSSEQTACYKASIVARLLAGKTEKGMADLTGGFGVDFSFLAPLFGKAAYVEQQALLCEAAQENFRLLGLEHARVVCGDGVEYRRQMDPVPMIYIDPSRRDTHGQRTFGIADCTPDVTAICDEIAEKCEWCLLKLSPMLDWHQAVKDVTSSGRLSVAEVHIVSVCNECKELLVLLSTSSLPASPEMEGRLVCVNDNQVFEVPLSALIHSSLPYSGGLEGNLEGSSPFLFEPNASIMKAGCFSELTAHYGVKAVGRNSHLFVSDHCIGDFPGRQFRIDAVTTLNKRELKAALSGMEKANIAVRNFPLSVAELRKRLHLKDGGETYIFATTVGERDHLLLICRKIS